jgi:glycosyltransferase involved in cell wall biosynthesis
MNLSGYDLHIVRSLPLSVYIRMGNAGKLMPYSTLTHSKADLTVFFNYLTPGGLKGKNMITIYDLVSERFPETMQGRNRRLLQGHLQDSATRASSILTISEFSKSEIIDVLGVPEEKIFVGPCGVDTEFYTPGEGFETGINKKFNLEKYVLYVGTLEPRKNIRTLVEAFSKISDKYPDVKLVLAGGLGWQPEATLKAIEESKAKDRIIRTGYISNEEKRDLLRNAQFFVFPSIYEGFGMPVTEAMACGTDAVVSESSSLIEISAGLVPLIDPKNAVLWAEAMEEKLNSKADDRKKQQLIDHARSYTWDKTAEAARSAIKYANMV